jgi:hypothetical protein
MKESFARFERAAAKRHKESIWILSVVKDVELEKNDLKDAFAKMEEPLGWYLAGELSEEGSREEFDFYKKSAEGGCSWGQAKYGWYFKRGDFVEKDEKVFEEWREKAAHQNNPEAMYRLGLRFRYNDMEKAVLYLLAASELGWKDSMLSLAELLRDGKGCVKDLRRAAIWSAKGDSWIYWDLLGDAKRALDSRSADELNRGFNQLCFALGWGLYWYACDSKEWKGHDKELQTFGSLCLDFYCATIELQRESIFTFLLFWNRAVGVKDVGALIGKMVWEEDRRVWVTRLWRN